MVEWLDAGRPVLVSTRGGLSEVADTYLGSVPVEPSTDALVGALAELTAPVRWAQAVAAVRPVDAEGPEEWAERHEAIYLAAVGGGRAGSAALESREGPSDG
jgi:hypothetical protein